MAGRIRLLETDADLELMSKVLGIKKAVAAVMANRGIRSKNAAIAYLRPDLEKAGDALTMKDAKKAFDRLASAVRKRERVMIYGDYDADGVMSTAILYKALKACGADVYYYIPHREEEGYGLNIEAVRTIKGNEHELLITCDNGIAALAEISEANALGMDVVVIDHHEPGFVEKEDGRQDVLPEALAVVDPKQSACPYPFKEMCAGGLAFKLMEAFYRYVGRDFAPLHDELLVFAMIATVCDIVDLKSENRSLVKRGLDVFNANKRVNAGLGQLVALRGYMDKPIDTFTIGFVIGPCINATGRLESAEMSVRLLLSQNPAEQESLSQTLNNLNEERKTLTKNCAERALASLKDETDSVLVLVDEKCHESIAGIVAGRIKETLHRPAIVLTRAADAAGTLKGSGRSIEGYNLFEALYANRELFLRFGGHAMAAGLTLHEDNAAELRRRLNESCRLTAEDMQAQIDIDMELPAEEITLDLAEQLAWLAPFGKGNHEPLFLTSRLTVTSLRMIDNKNTMIFNFGSLKGIAFGLNEAFTEDLQKAFDEPSYRRIASGQVSGLTLDVIHTVETNTYNGRTTAQMRIKHLKIVPKPEYAHAMEVLEQS